MDEWFGPSAFAAPSSSYGNSPKNFLLCAVLLAFVFVCLFAADTNAAVSPQEACKVEISAYLKKHKLCRQI